MKLRRKSRGNRRVWRESYLLEVKAPLGRRFSRQAQWASRILPVVIVSAIGVMLMWGGFAFLRQRFLHDNPGFKIQRIEAVTDGVIPAEDLTQWCGVQLGQNLAAVDVSKVKARLEQVAFIREARVTKSFPGKLRVQVTERVAVAKLTPSGTQAMYFLDDAGVVFSAVRGKDGRVIAPSGAKTMPVVTGVSASQVVAGKRPQTEGVMLAIQAIQQCEKMGILPYLDLHAVDVSQPSVLRFVVGRGGSIVLEPQNIETQLQRLHVILWKAKSERREIRTADLRGARSVAVTYF